MKWNWGTKLLIAIISFMSLIIVLAVFSMKQSFFLVEKDYYPKGLEYQQKIKKTENAQKAGELIMIKNKGSELLISFPSLFDLNQLEGNLFFYRPSDGTKDITIPILVDSLGLMICSTQNLENGKYILKFDYKVNDKEYFQEETVFIQK
ncbi:MAG: hypothetical protein GY834_11890 [Bacteroidetes bacterium]|nr:hypothetical protein [Bacteroidota bacterium]